jgi:hypothetical protein
MWSLPFTFSPFPGQLPVNTTLKVHNVLFSEVATAKKIMAFDMALQTASSYDAFAQSGGFGTSAWAYVRDYDVDTTVLHHSATDVYCIADEAVAAGSRGTVTVVGYVTSVAKVNGTNAKNQPYTASMAAVGTLAPTATTPTTLVAGARVRKVVAKQVGADVSAVLANVHFNGFGWGVTFKNVAVDAD